MRDSGQQVAATLDEREQAALRAHIQSRGARAVARATGLSVDAVTLAASGGKPKAGTSLVLRSWLAGTP